MTAPYDWRHTLRRKPSSKRLTDNGELPSHFRRQGLSGFPSIQRTVLQAEKKVDGYPRRPQPGICNRA